MDKKCPIEYTISLINGKWKLLILKELSQKELRYGELVRVIPSISSKVLIAQLRELEADGLIIRTVYPEVPPKVEYALSPKGSSVFDIFGTLRTWGLSFDEKEEVTCKFCKKCQPLIEKRKAAETLNTNKSRA